MHFHQRLHEAFVGAGADAQHDGFVAALRGDVRVAHVRIDIDRFARAEHVDVVELGVHFDAPLEHVHELLAGVMHELAELAQALRADAREHRDHAFAAQLGAQVVVLVVARVHAQRRVQPADAAPGGHWR